MRGFQRFVFFFALIMQIGLFAGIAKATDGSKIYFFYGNGCPHCSLVEQYFEKEKIFETYPVEKKEIYFNRANALLFNNLLANLNIPETERGVPTVVLGDKIISGDRPIIESFRRVADEYLGDSKQPEDLKVEQSNPSTIENKSGLTLAAIITGSLVDAINPCEFAVLIILLSTIMVSGSPKKALLTGLAFSASIFISYFLMGIGLYEALSLGAISAWFMQILGWIAILLGLFNLKDYFWYGKGFLMEVPLRWRPRMKQLIHSVTSPVGAFFIGFIISLFLLPCTSGPYIVILGLLAKNSLDTKAILYLLLYNVIFVSPMVLITLAIYRGFDPEKAEELRLKRLQTLHLITGLVMLIMGIALLSNWL